MRTCVEITQEPTRVVQPGEVPNPEWLVPGTPGAGQQVVGSPLLEQHGIVLLPSASSRFSWNLVIEPGVAKGRYRLHSQAQFVLDTRLPPPTPASNKTFFEQAGLYSKVRKGSLQIPG